MLAESAFGFALDDDDRLAPGPPVLSRAASVGNSWGVTCIGRGFDWNSNDDHLARPSSTDSGSSPERNNKPSVPGLPKRASIKPPLRRSSAISVITTPYEKSQNFFLESDFQLSSQLTDSPISDLPLRMSQPYSPFETLQPPAPFQPTPELNQPPPLRSPTLSRPRRRSSQQRVSLIAGRVSIAPIEPPSPSLAMPQILRRSGSTGNVLSSVVSTRAPTPTSDGKILPDGKTISDFFIEREIGRGAYGLVKRAREYKSDGTLGVRCWLFCTTNSIPHHVAATSGHQANNQVAYSC